MLPRKKILFPAILILAVIFAYEAVRYNSFVYIDDGGYIWNNQRVLSGLSWANIKWAFTTLEMANWHPLTWISYLIDCELYGLRPGGHHVVSIFIHAGSTIVLFTVLSIITKSRNFSFLGALIFGIHPLHVESVAWASERKDLLFGFFFILALLFYLKFHESKKKWWIIGCFISFMLSLLSKPMAISFPFMLILMDIWPLNRWDVSFSNLVKSHLEKVPFFLLSFGSGCMTYYAQSKVGAVNSLSAIPFSSRLWNGIISYGIYLKQYIIPGDLNFFYPFHHDRLFLQALFVLALLVGILVLALRYKREAPFILVGLAWFFITLFPVSGIISFGGQAHADRYTYIPYIGLTFILIMSLKAMAKRGKNHKTIVFFLITIFCGHLFYKTRAQVKVWRNSVSLYSHSYKLDQGNLQAIIGLGGQFYDAHLYCEAQKWFEKAVKIKPESRFEYKLAISYQSAGMTLAAEDAFMRAVMLNTNSIFTAISYANLGMLYEEWGLYELAENCYIQSIEIHPEFKIGFLKLGQLYLDQGERDVAEELFQLGLTFSFDPLELKGLLLIDSWTIEMEQALSKMQLTRRLTGN